MFAHIRSIYKISLTVFLIPVLAVTIAVCPVIAGGPTHPEWTAVKLPVEASRVVICQRPEREFLAAQPTFVITHGMGGTEAGDRFHRLADAICDVFPEANVLIVDWSKNSWRTRGCFQIPSPWDVAQNVDPVARETAELLKVLQIAPARTTFIGESFGNCVNARIAETLGGRGRILAFNPANDLSGYKTPDLRTCSDVAWSFQTYSLCDCQSPSADVGFFLETPANASARDQHTQEKSWTSHCHATMSSTRRKVNPRSH